jgi:hypothetical protein
MTGTNCDLFTHKSSRSYLNHLVNIYIYIYITNVKIKLFLYKSRQASENQEGEAPRISIQSAHEGHKVVSPTHLPHLPPRKDPWYLFTLEAESTPGPQCGRKDYVSEKSRRHHREANR